MIENKIKILMSGYCRNSFDRFGDDLCEEISQYLTFEDKLMFECVSKQFYRCVYQRQYSLKANDYKYLCGHDLLPYNKLLSHSTQHNLSKEKIDVKISNFERVLKKCKKINRLLIRNDAKFMSTNNLLRIIIDNCNDLKEITVYKKNGVEISDNTLNDFGIKFGKTLKKINIEMSELSCLIKHCPNIVSISYINISNLIASDLELPKLIEVRRIEGCDVKNNMKTFVEKYRNTLKVFDARHTIHDWFTFMLNLSHLTKLENISFEYNGEYDQNDIINGLKVLSVNCELKHLQIDYNYNSNDCDNQLLNAINGFTQLKSLRLSQTFFSRNQSVEVIKNCKHLTLLEVDGAIHDTFYKDINKYLPKLTVVEISFFEFGEDYFKISDETFYYLSELEQLRVIKVYSNEAKNMTHTGICNVIEKCLHFRSFHFNKCPQITSQTIQVLTDIAKSRPHNNYHHILGDCSTEEYTMILTSIKKHGSPINLKLSYTF